MEMALVVWGERCAVIREQPHTRKTAQPTRTPFCRWGCQALQRGKVAREAALGPRCTYPLGEIEGSDAQWPEAAEHGEESETQVVPGRQREEVVFAFTLCGGGLTLWNSGVTPACQTGKGSKEIKKVLSRAMIWSDRECRLVLPLYQKP